jgi:hypothetical protein
VALIGRFSGIFWPFSLSGMTHRILFIAAATGGGGGVLQPQFFLHAS